MIDEALLARALAWEDAQSLRDESLEFFPDDGGERGVVLKVVEVSSQGRSGEVRQFAILFRGPSSPVHPQRIYRFRHARLGDYAFFITPIAQSPEGTDYEACFCHAA